MAARLPHVTAAELKVLKVLWRIKSGAVRDVKEHLEKEDGEPPAYTTVMTIMNQLAAKGALKVDKDRQPYIYRPAVRREQVLTERLQNFVNTVFDGQVGELVLRLVEEAEISPEDLKRIEAKIEAREKADGERPGRVARGEAEQ
jgi:predicted transcriptional regulator